MQGKSGNRERSILMFLNMAKFVEPENRVCIEIAEKIEQIAAGVFLGGQPIDATLIRALENTQKQVF